MCRMLHRSFACGHQEDLLIPCASHSILATITSQSSISSINVPQVIEWRAEAEQFLLNQCMAQSAEPEMKRESRELCLECASTTYFTRRAMRSNSGSQFFEDPDIPGKKWHKTTFNGLRWRDKDGVLREVTDKTNQQPPTPPSKTGDPEKDRSRLPCITLPFGYKRATFNGRTRFWKENTETDHRPLEVRKIRGSEESGGSGETTRASSIMSTKVDRPSQDTTRPSSILSTSVSMNNLGGTLRGKRESSILSFFMKNDDKVRGDRESGG